MGRKPKKIKPPIWLDEVAKEEFKRIEKLLREEEKDFTEKDIKALEAYSRNYSKWVAAELILIKEGTNMIVNEEGYEQQRPEVSIANKAQQECRAWAKELGITPSARARMNKGLVKSDGDIDEEMEGMISK
ncbi:phage terminase small subunit P27 family [Clostridium paraputrificum]|jgi:P27 family predicted phage terminase small subunit|uniref:phage terminase small subunit P27 family n=1 Tax=Clostridium paraputrificum TaxID=29363 RepID=UPI000C067F49|nr:phage terminase small subunit P27 family [Clostridium paraputrificum]MBS7130528.1 phage terminase small subunit P27 family [Clostridium sp.]DAU88756.1 MAG TPA: terminase small subunit [Caudoviricetes sp.]